MIKIVDLYGSRTPGSAALHSRAAHVMPGGDTRTVVFFAPYPLYIERAGGCVMTDVDGNEYLDFLGNYTSLVHGHARREIVEAMVDQARLGTAHAGGSQAAVELAELLVDRVPSVESVRFANSGTEAVIHAVRAARAFTGRDKILKLEGGYHGSADFAEISVDPTMELAGPPERPHSVPDEAGIPASAIRDVVVARYNDLDSVKRAFERAPGELAAVLVEPMLGAAGAVPADPHFLAGLREACDADGSLLIFDEVITFRLALGGLGQALGVMADLTTFGKVIGGGLPVGAFGGRSNVMALFAPPGNALIHSGTFNANPITMRAGRVALDLLSSDEIARINELGDHLATGLRQVIDDLGIPAQVTGIGSIRTVHITDSAVVDYRSKARSNRRFSRLLHLALLNEGIFIAPRGMFVTSTAMTTSTVDACVEAFARAAGAVLAEIGTAEVR